MLGNKGLNVAMSSQLTRSTSNDMVRPFLERNAFALSQRLARGERVKAAAKPHRRRRRKRRRRDAALTRSSTQARSSSERRSQP
jgi:hypothetical protein